MPVARVQSGAWPADRPSRVGRQVLAVLLVLAGPGAVSAGQAVSAARQPGVHALVVGISDYADGRLEHGRRRAEEVAKALTDTFPSAKPIVLLDADATRARMEQVLFSEFPQLPDHSLLFVYFAGHGKRQTYRTRENSLGVQSDCLLLLHGATHQDPWGKSLRAEEILDALKRSGRCNWIILLDCCFAGREKTNLFELGKKEQQLLGVRAVGMAATDARQQAWKGIFTQHLLKKWREAPKAGQPCLKPASLFEAVREAVDQESGNLITPQFFLGEGVEVCLWELDKPGYLLVCEASSGSLGSCKFTLDQEKPAFWDFAKERFPYCRYLPRNKRFTLTVSFQGRAISLPSSDLEPPPDQDIRVLPLDGRFGERADAGSLELSADLAKATAEVIEAFGVNPAAYYNRAAGYAGAAAAQLGLDRRADVALLWQRALHFARRDPDSVEYTKAAVALGIRSFGEVQGDERLARDLVTIGAYDTAGAAFRELALGTRDTDLKAPLLLNALVSYNVAGLVRRAEGIKAEDIIGQGLSDSQVDYLSDFPVADSAGPLVARASVQTTLTGIAVPDERHRATNLAWTLDALPAKGDLEGGFRGLLKAEPSRSVDADTALALQLAGLVLYTERKVLTQEAARLLVGEARREWARRRGLQVGGSEKLTEPEMDQLRRSRNASILLSHLEKFGLR
jgi:Caspase domain